MKNSGMSILDIVNKEMDDPTTRTSIDTDRVTLVERDLDGDMGGDVEMMMDVDTEQYTNIADEESQHYQPSEQYSVQDDIIAVKALESLDPSSSNERQDIKSEKFLKRVYSIPFLNNTVNSITNCYESTKNSSGVLKYSAESMESVTMRVTLPVLNTLEPVLTPLDRFACNQLDRVEKRFPFISGYTHPVDERSSTEDYYKQETQENVEHVENGQIPEKSRSRWPKVVGSVGANLGVLKKETLEALRYCIEIIQYASNAIIGQITVLKQAITAGTQ